MIATIGRTDGHYMGSVNKPKLDPRHRATIAVSSQRVLAKCSSHVSRVRSRPPTSPGVDENMLAAIAATEPTSDFVARSSGRQIVFKLLARITAFHDEPRRATCEYFARRSCRDKYATATAGWTLHVRSSCTIRNRALHWTSCHRPCSNLILPRRRRKTCAVRTPCFHFFPKCCPWMTRSIESSHKSG